MKSPHLYPLLIVALMLGCGVPTTNACPMCKDARSTDAPQNLTTVAAASEFSSSIYTLLGGVTIAAFVMGTAIYKSLRDPQ